MRSLPPLPIDAEDLPLASTSLGVEGVNLRFAIHMRYWQKEQVWALRLLSKA
jgi:hypothetical protein